MRTAASQPEMGGGKFSGPQKTRCSADPEAGEGPAEGPAHREAGLDLGLVLADGDDAVAPPGVPELGQKGVARLEARHEGPLLAEALGPVLARAHDNPVPRALDVGELRGAGAFEAGPRREGAWAEPAHGARESLDLPWWITFTQNPAKATQTN